jgi:hypothetical protein
MPNALSLGFLLPFFNGSWVAMNFGQLADWELAMRTVPRSFRDLVARELPGLGTDKRFWLFLEYLIFTGFRDVTTHKPCIPSSLVKQIGGTNTAAQFLDEFSEKVVTIEYTDDWSYSTKQCRTVTWIDWPPAVEEALQARYRIVPGDRVYLRTGNRVTSKTQSHHRANLERAAEEYAKDANAAQKRMLDYLNKRPSNKFMTIAKMNRDKAHVEADKLEAEYDRQRVHMLIDNILDQPKPVYRPSRKGNTDRIFGIGESFLTLPSSVRHVLLGGWYEFDLKSAQCAIVARFWDIDVLSEFLGAGGDIWSELISYFDGRIDKDFLKPLVYTVINGGSKRFIKYVADGHLGAGGGDRFFAHPFIQVLWRSRQAMMKQIVRNRGVQDAFENWIKLEWEEHRSGRRIPNVGSVIAQQAQSYELLLLLPVYELADLTDEFTIMLHQHDGLTIAIHEKRRIEQWISKITAAVQAQADRLDIHTHLVLD